MENFAKQDIFKVSSPSFGDYIVLNGAIMSKKNCIAWLNDHLNKIATKKMSGSI